MFTVWGEAREVPARISMPGGGQPGGLSTLPILHHPPPPGVLESLSAPHRRWQPVMDGLLPAGHYQPLCQDDNVIFNISSSDLRFIFRLGASEPSQRALHRVLGRGSRPLGGELLNTPVPRGHPLGCRECSRS